MQEELNNIEQEKEFLENEDKIVEAIRYKLQEKLTGVASPYVPHRSVHDSKLEQKMPKSTEREVVEQEAAERGTYEKEEEESQEMIRDRVKEKLGLKKKEAKVAEKEEIKVSEEKIVEDNATDKLKKYLINRKK